MFKKSLLTFLTILLSTSCFADLKLENPECRTVILSDDGTWHYGGKVLEQKKYRKLTINELKQKFGHFKDKALKVSGTGLVIIDTYFIKDGFADDNPIEMNVAAIAKGLTDKLEQDCEKGCAITAYGEIHIADDGYKTLVLERLEIE